MSVNQSKLVEELQALGLTKITEGVLDKTKSPTKTEQSGNIFRTTGVIDFISDMGSPSMFLNMTDKKLVLEKLNGLIQFAQKHQKTCGILGGVISIVFREAFNLLEQTKILSNEEKIKWITENNTFLPPPFLMLNAIYLSQKEPGGNEATAWHNLASFRLVIDAEMCKDVSAQAGLGIIMQYFNPRFEWGSLLMEHIVTARTNSVDRMIELHSQNPTQVQLPFWIANHGMNAIVGLNNQDRFLPESSRAALEKKHLETFLNRKKTLQQDVARAKLAIEAEITAFSKELKQYGEQSLRQLYGDASFNRFMEIKKLIEAQPEQGQGPSPAAPLVPQFQNGQQGSATQSSNPAADKKDGAVRSNAAP